MNKIALILTILCTLSLTACSSQSDKGKTESTVVASKQVSEPVTKVPTITVFDFLKDFYNNYVFYGAKELTPAIADKYLTKTLAQKLIDDYPYESDDDCYAVWEFRSGYQDGPTNESKIMSVKKLNGDNYEARICDLGNIGTINLQVIRYGDEYRINSIGSFQKEISDDDLIIECLRMMYNQKQYKQDSWLREHCSRSMLNYLESLNPYEGGGYGWWIFEGREAGEDVNLSFVSVGWITNTSKYYVRFINSYTDRMRDLILDIQVVDKSILINNARIER